MGLFRLYIGKAAQEPIWASGVPKLSLLSHFSVYWGLATERTKTRILPCNMSFSKICLFRISVLYRFDGHFELWVTAYPGYWKTERYWPIMGLFRLYSGSVAQEPIWAPGVPKLSLLSHFTVYWGPAIERKKTRIMPCNMSFSFFPGSLNSLVLSWNVKNTSFLNGISIAPQHWRFRISVLWRFDGHFELWVTA